MKYLISVVIAALMSAVSIFIYWCGGGEFIRSPSLGNALVVALLCFIFGFFMSVTCPVWNRKNG